MFYEEIRIKQGFSNISFCPLRILYNSKFIIMATPLGTNAVVITEGITEGSLQLDTLTPFFFFSLKSEHIYLTTYVSAYLYIIKKSVQNFLLLYGVVQSGSTKRIC